MQQAPLSDAELDELADFLVSDATPDNCMDISELDGFFTALIIGPNTILPSQWLPVIWGETADDPMKFATNEQAARIMDLVMRLYNERGEDLQEDIDLYDPIIYTNKVEGKIHSIIDEWCTGFMQGVQLDPIAWDPLFQSEEDAALLTPMILYGTETGIEQLQQTPTLQARHEQLADALGICVISIRDYWLPLRRSALVGTFRRETDKIGRNDLCPCGSGKKYKKCCGSPETLH